LRKLADGRSASATLGGADRGATREGRGFFVERATDQIQRQVLDRLGIYAAHHGHA
jgi:hypothetical protein